MKRFSHTRQKSLDLLRQFVRETPKEKVKELLDKYASSNPNGLTYAQYLAALEQQVNFNTLIRRSKKLYTLRTYKVLSDSIWEHKRRPSVPPPQEIIITNKKDPKYSGSFLF